MESTLFEPSWKCSRFIVQGTPAAFKTERLDVKLAIFWCPGKRILPFTVPSRGRNTSRETLGFYRFGCFQTEFAQAFGWLEGDTKRKRPVLDSPQFETSRFAPATLNYCGCLWRAETHPPAPGGLPGISGPTCRASSSIGARHTFRWIEDRGACHRKRRALRHVPPDSMVTCPFGTTNQIRGSNESPWTTSSN